MRALVKEKARRSRRERFGMVDVDETMQSSANFQTEPETPPLNVKH